MLPLNKPQITRREALEKYLPERSIDECLLLGVRGYYLNTMGERNKNDRAIYDDAIFIISPSIFLSYNANTDPSRYGINAKINKGMAVLQAGEYLYQIGKHGINRERQTNGRVKAYTALVQKSPVNVLRDGKNSIESGMFAINIHRGGNTTTSSEGCQTILPVQWDEFISIVQGEMKRLKQKDIKYILVEENEKRK